MASALHLRLACRALRAGGVIAYPTEAVWGLGCEPQDREACVRLLAIKQRDWRKGVILVGADFEQLRPYVADLSESQLRPAFDSWPGPATWLMPASSTAPSWITGTHASIAVRVSAHAGVAALCRAYGGALVSTSANLASHAPARTRAQLQARLGEALDFIVPGELGGAKNPSTIRDLLTGKLLRA